MATPQRDENKNATSPNQDTTNYKWPERIQLRHQIKPAEQEAKKERRKERKEERKRHSKSPKLK